MAEKATFIDKMREDLVLLDIKGDTNEEVLREVAKVLEAKGIVKETYADALVQREMEYPTGLPIGEMNCAIPHTYPEHINEIAIALVVLDKPVKFQQMGDPDEQVDVSVLICLAMKKMDDNVKLLPALMGFFADEENLKTLTTMKDPKAILDYIKENC